METETKKRKPAWGDLGCFAATVSLVLLPNLVELRFDGDWSPEYSATISRLLPSYVAACLVLAVIAVFLACESFPSTLPSLPRALRCCFSRPALSS